MNTVSIPQSEAINLCQKWLNQRTGFIAEMVAKYTPIFLLENQKHALEIQPTQADVEALISMRCREKYPEYSIKEILTSLETKTNYRTSATSSDLLINLNLEDFSTLNSGFSDFTPSNRFVNDHLFKIEEAKYNSTIKKKRFYQKIDWDSVLAIICLIGLILFNGWIGYMIALRFNQPVVGTTVMVVCKMMGEIPCP